MKKVIKETPKRVAPSKAIPKMPVPVSGAKSAKGSDSSGVIPRSLLKRHGTHIDLAESEGSPRQGSRPQMQGPGGNDAAAKAPKSKKK